MKRQIEPPMRSKLLCEFVGSLFLVMAAIGPIILFNNVIVGADPGTTLALAVIADALAVGFVLFLLIEIFLPVSGAQFNPAVTIAIVMDRKMSAMDGMKYISAQFTGGFTGMLAVHAMYIHHGAEMLQVSDVVRSEGAYIAEFFGTFILVMAVFFLVRHRSRFLSLGIGMLVGGMLMTTSSTMFANPQVTVARMFTYSAAGIRPLDGGVFIAVEIAAAVTAVFFYRSVYGYLDEWERPTPKPENSV